MEWPEIVFDDFNIRLDQDPFKDVQSLAVFYGVGLRVQKSTIPLILHAPSLGFSFAKFMRGMAWMLYNKGKLSKHQRDDIFVDVAMIGDLP